MTYSFVLCVKDRQALLTHCLKGISQQSHRTFEVIVVDYGSVKPIAVPEPARLVRLERSGWNASIALNAGIANANGEYLVLLDCDGVLAPDLLAVVNQKMSAT